MMADKAGRTIVVGKRGHPKRPRSEAAEFGRLVEAERAAGARTIGEAMMRVIRRDRRNPRRWGSTRKMNALWAEFQKRSGNRKPRPPVSPRTWLRSLRHLNATWPRRNGKLIWRRSKSRRNLPA